MTMKSKMAPPGKKGTPSRRVFWDVEYREQEPYSRPMGGDEKACAAILIKAIQDLKGVSTDAQKECVICHRNEHPECFTVTRRAGEDFIVRCIRGCNEWHTHQQCAAAWIASDAIQPRDAEGYTFVHLCDTIGVEPSYLRRCLNKSECEAYWKDEKKINSFLGFLDTKASCNTGRPDPEGEAN